MCGISGIVNFFQFRNKDESIKKLKLMTENLKHRGPDSIGYEYNKNYLFGHTRLSIIDLSSNGNQPMSDVTGQISITFNGEIYNYKNLRSILVQKGYVFFSNSDTEVMLYGYQEYGLDKFLNMCDGFWAFALYDNLKDELYLCRDRFGKKPLFYTKIGNNCFFSSTTHSLKPILRSKELRKDVVKDYLNIGFIPPNKCIVKNVEKVLPGTFIKMTKESTLTREYWQINFNNHFDNISKEDSMDQIEKLLTNSVKNRMVADVDIGTFLSGGLDSALITALASKLNPDIDSYTMTIPGSGLNEEYGAKITSDHLNINQNELEINPDIFMGLESAVSAYSEPFGDSSLLPMDILSKMASPFKKVILTGDGGDEGFNAYSRYCFFKNIMNKKKSNLSSYLLSFIGNYFWNSPPISMAMRGRYRSQDWIVQNGGVKEYINCRWQLLNSTLLKILIPGGSEHNLSSNKYINEILSKNYDLDERQKIMYSGIKFELAGDFLVKLDTGSMQNGLELRSPFLDHNLIQFLINVPTNIWGVSGKKELLNKLVKKHLPKELLYLPKRGFSFPLQEYLTNLWVINIDKLFEKPLIVELGYVKLSGLMKIYDWVKHDKNTDWRIIRLLFCLISFEYWLKEWEIN